MNSEHIPNGQVSDERLREMLAGLEGVTPGPWVWGARYIGVGNVMLGKYTPIAQTPNGMIAPDGGQWDANAAHIARCDPDTMRQVLTLALAALTRRSSAGVKGETKIEAQPIHALPMPPYDFQGNAALTPSPTLEPTDAEVELIERLERGVINIGLHDDNSTELFDIEEANDTMADAAVAIRALIASRQSTSGEGV